MLPWLVPCPARVERLEMAVLCRNKRCSPPWIRFSILWVWPAQLRKHLFLSDQVYNSVFLICDTLWHWLISVFLECTVEINLTRIHFFQSSHPLFIMGALARYLDMLRIWQLFRANIVFLSYSPILESIFRIFQQFPSSYSLILLSAFIGLCPSLSLFCHESISP
jgi:hypothetical protein